MLLFGKNLYELLQSYRIESISLFLVFTGKGEGAKAVRPIGAGNGIVKPIGE